MQREAARSTVLDYLDPPFDFDFLRFLKFLFPSFVQFCDEFLGCLELFLCICCLSHSTTAALCVEYLKLKCERKWKIMFLNRDWIINRVAE